MSDQVAAIVVAGGVGKRLKSRVRKPFIRLGSRPMLAWTLKAFEGTPQVHSIVVVTHPADITRAERLISEYRFKKVTAVVAGGSTRSDSVFQGLQALPKGVKWVAVHDAARPLISRRLIRSALKAGKRYRAAVVAVPVVPTVKEVRRHWVTRTLDRDHLWAIQTPQVFRLDLLKSAHQKGRRRKRAPTDDAALVEALGFPVRIVPGSPRNLKVTTPDDLVMAEAFLRR